MPPPPTFDPRFLVGIEQVDREHRQLFAIVDQVEAALAGGPQAGVTLHEAVGALVDYTRTHFASEESLMASLGYPSLAAHRSLHTSLLRHVDDMKMRVDLGDESAILDLSRFLHDWLVGHIQSADRDFGLFARASTC